ncbi:hypothetical protein [Sporisorium scitamineum]|uniref:Nascent polypeptide-associated complex subunit alpha-like UBA domain-containing protein n=1 Tax=Sporisorium scitamineum TaxID=49012 RepID=A0A0F7SDD2_9BASI|nr:hypothetical protein [Sporisorium scitamineum]
MAAKPQAEVIQEWVDFDSAGYSFVRGRMEKTVQSLCFGDNAATVPAHIAAGPSQGQKLKKEDVDFIVAEATLAKHNGDMEKALAELVSGP